MQRRRIKAPVGATEPREAEAKEIPFCPLIPKLLSPLRGLRSFIICKPRACALGFTLPPLSGADRVAANDQDSFALRYNSESSLNYISGAAFFARAVGALRAALLRAVVPSPLAAEASLFALLLFLGFGSMTELTASDTAEAVSFIISRAPVAMSSEISRTGSGMMVRAACSVADATA